MVVCPRCAYPHPGDIRIIAERDVVCSRCDWKGPSSSLLLVDDDKIVDPRVFDQFYTFLHKEVAPVVGRALIQLGVVSGGRSSAEVMHLARVLRDFTSAGLEAIVKRVMNPDG